MGTEFSIMSWRNGTMSAEHSVISALHVNMGAHTALRA